MQSKWRIAIRLVTYGLAMAANGGNLCRFQAMLFEHMVNGQCQNSGEFHISFAKQGDLSWMIFTQV